VAGSLRRFSGRGTCAVRLLLLGSRATSLALRLLPALACSASLFFALPARAQTWVDERTTPGLRELIAVDQTGEPSWLFGSEDIAGDGTSNFNAAEQAADVRSAYAATAGRQLWLRLYVSARTAPDALRAFVFVDTDNDALSGGPARAPEIDPAFDSNTAGSGYEIALAWSGTALLGAWRWTPGTGNGANAAAYRPLSDLEPLHAHTEIGTDLDPLRLNAAENGYVQLALDFEPLALSVRCEANLLFRSIGSTLLRDLDVGRAGPCVPGDADDNGVADVAEPDDARCTSDAQCPAGGICSDGQCAAAPLVLAPGERVQGGAFTCNSSAGPLGAHARWSALALFGTLLGVSRLRRWRRGRAAC
jgi:hypothetical protein